MVEKFAKDPNKRSKLTVFRSVCDLDEIRVVVRVWRVSGPEFSELDMSIPSDEEAGLSFGLFQAGVGVLRQDFSSAIGRELRD